MADSKHFSIRPTARAQKAFFEFLIATEHKEKQLGVRRIVELK